LKPVTKIHIVMVEKVTGKPLGDLVFPEETLIGDLNNAIVIWFPKDKIFPEKDLKGIVSATGRPVIALINGAEIGYIKEIVEWVKDESKEN